MTSGPEATRALREEAAAIYGAMFREDAPEGLLADYAAAARHYPELERPVLVRPGSWTPLRLEAVEFYLRLRRPANGLSRRFTVVAYLAEARPETCSRFRGGPRPWVAAAGVVVLQAARAGLLAPLGWLLGRRFDA